MNNTLLVSKIVLGIFVTLLIITPFIGQHCGNMNLVESDSMCHIYIFQQSTTNIEKVNQLMLAIVGNQNYLLVILLVVIVSSGLLLLVIKSNKFSKKINFKFLMVYKKPWNVLYFALTHGIIHGKYFY